MSSQVNTASMSFGLASPAPLQGLHRFGRTVWQGLKAVGQSRARHELLRQAQLRAGSDPALAQRLREAANYPR